MTNATTELSAMTDFEKQMLADASVTVETEAATNSAVIKAKNKRFSSGGIDLGPQMDVVITDTVFENAFYDNQAYDQDNIRPPSCFALSLDGETGNDMLTPYPTSPEKQAESCAQCKWNEYESALIGRGKACKNSRRVSLIAYDEQGVSSGQLAFLKLPPTSLIPMSQYLLGLATQYKRPCYGVVTTLTFDPKVDYGRILPVFKSLLTSEEDLRFIMGIKKQSSDMIRKPYDVSSYQPPKPAKKSKMA